MADVLQTIERYRALGIDQQIDYKKFYLYSIITHSTAIEGSTVTEIENQLLFDEGITAPGRTLQEQMMNLDLKAAYEEAQRLADRHMPYSIDMLCRLSAIVMKNTGSTYNTPLGSFSAAEGELRKVNVTAGFGGRSYLAHEKVPQALSDFCRWLNTERAAMPKNDITCFNGSSGLFRLRYSKSKKLNISKHSTTRVTNKTNRSSLLSCCVCITPTCNPRLTRLWQVKRQMSLKVSFKMSFKVSLKTLLRSLSRIRRSRVRNWRHYCM